MPASAKLYFHVIWVDPSKILKTLEGEMLNYL